MNEEIVITYKTETIKVSDFTERDKAIFNAGMQNGRMLSEENKFKMIAIALFVGMIIIGIFFDRVL